MEKENKDLTHFFDDLPANRNSYGGDTMAYLENLEEPETEKTNSQPERKRG